MRWKPMAKGAGLLGADSPNLGRASRRLPLSYFFAALLFFLLLPHITYKILLQSDSFLKTTTVFGDNLLPTPWHWHDNPLGRHNHTMRRSLEVLNCSYRRWIFSSSPALSPSNRTESEECPSYFNWIHKDLAPWRETGITQTYISRAREHAAFKVVILNGKLYVDLYYSCVQTRTVFTVWGILLLLEKYNGQVPDVEMLFDCMDRPHIEKSREDLNGFLSPPPLFRYCSNSYHYDIPWPDWSFWGWSETELEPWDVEFEKIVGGSKQKEWKHKAPKAYWRGNPDVGSPLRMELLKCNNATKAPRAAIHTQDWTEELSSGKQNSKLENQCQHRYKIYAEGFAWSVSFKYIMACGSPTLVISPAYYDFFMRGLEPGIHYLPVRPSKICSPKLCGAIDKQVKSGEANPSKAFRIGKAGQEFLRKQVGMQNVYDYMFQMLGAYSALQRFKPSIPKTASQVTQAFILCLAQPHERLLLEKSRMNLQSGTPPCKMPGTPLEKLKDFEWEAKEHISKVWGEDTCGVEAQL